MYLKTQNFLVSIIFWNNVTLNVVIYLTMEIFTQNK